MPDDGYFDLDSGALKVMTDFDLCSLIAAMGISQVEFARRIGKGERTIRGYCSGERPIPLLVQREAARMWEEHEARVK